MTCNLRRHALTCMGSNATISWNGASSVLTNDQQTYDVSTHIAQDLSAGAGTAIGEALEAELVVLDTATVVSGGGRHYVISYGTDSVTADLYLYEGVLCVGATFDLVSGYVQDDDGHYTIRSYYTSDLANIDTLACPPDAVVRVNEVKANIANGCDMVELRVVVGGSLTGFTVYERDSIVFTFGSMAVAKNDYVVLHFNADNLTNCNPANAYSEFASKPGQPAATYTQNFDSASDMQLSGDGITATSTVITIYSSTGGIVDAVPLTVGTTKASNPAEAQAEILRAADQWWMSDGTAATANFFVDANFTAHAVPDLNAEGAQDVLTGNSIQRLNDVDTNMMGDWTSTNAAPSWGANNAGQSDLP
ncbi:MAG: hypothetical protein ABIJ09_21940 [Pseudomonadota bacterium]